MLLDNPGHYALCGKWIWFFFFFYLYDDDEDVDDDMFKQVQMSECHKVLHGLIYFFFLSNKLILNSVNKQWRFQRESSSSLMWFFTKIADDILGVRETRLAYIYPPETEAGGKWSQNDE